MVLNLVCIKRSVPRYGRYTAKYRTPDKGTASNSNDSVLCLDCDSRRAFGPTKTIRGVFWTQINRAERLASLSVLRERSLYV